MTQQKEYTDENCWVDIDTMIEKFEAVLGNIVENDKDLHMEPRITLTLDTPGLVNSLTYKNHTALTDFTKDLSLDTIETFLLTNELASGFEVLIFDDAPDAEGVPGTNTYDVIFNYNPYGESVIVMMSDELSEDDEDE